MNETNHAIDPSDAPWPLSDRRLPVAATTAQSGGDRAAPPLVGLLNQAVKGAHDTIDRLADGAAPGARHLDQQVSAAEQALHAKTAQLRDTRDEWVEGVRSSVRGHPLASIAIAAALGAVIARIAR